VKKWYVYIVECFDGTLYTGITTDINRRLNQHNSGKGAKYTSIRRPVKLMSISEVGDRSDASKEEYRIKQLTRKEKFEYILKNVKNKNE
jgi:putative endonuclease